MMGGMRVRQVRHPIGQSHAGKTGMTVLGHPQLDPLPASYVSSASIPVPLPNGLSSGTPTRASRPVSRSDWLPDTFGT